MFIPVRRNVSWSNLNGKRNIGMRLSNNCLRHNWKCSEQKFRHFFRGQIFGLIIALTGILSGAICVALAPTAGHAWAGAGISGGSLATLVGIFVYGRKTRSEQEESDRE
jgi:hypothetical protein